MALPTNSAGDITNTEKYQLRSDPYWNPIFSFIEERTEKRFILPPFVAFKHYDNGVTYLEVVEVDGFDYFVLFKGMLLSCDFSILDATVTKQCVYANDVFVIYDLRKEGQGLSETTYYEHTRSVDEEYAAVKSEAIDPQKLVFVHIPKCAGTSLYDSLKGQSARCLYYSGTSTYLNSKVRKFDHLNIIAGHFSKFNIRKKFTKGTDIEWVTILRDPLERLLSLIQHARRTDMENFGPAMTAMRTKRISEILESRQFFVDMHQTFIYLANRNPKDINENNLPEVARECVEFLEEDNVTFGFQDSMDDLPRLLNMKLGYGLDVPKQLNVGKKKKYEKSMEDAKVLIDEIKARLEVDFWFFEAAKSIYARRFAGLLESKVVVDRREFEPRFKSRGSYVETFGPYCSLTAGLYKLTIKSKKSAELTFDIYDGTCDRVYCSDVLSANFGSKQFKLPNINAMEVRLHRVPNEVLPLSVKFTKL